MNTLDRLYAKAAELEAKLLKVYAQIAEAEEADDDDDADDADDDDDELDGLAAQLAEVFIHTPRKGLPEHDASDPQTGCPDCLAAGLVTMPKARRSGSRRQRAA